MLLGHPPAVGLALHLVAMMEKGWEICADLGMTGLDLWMFHVLVDCLKVVRVCNPTTIRA